MDCAVHPWTASPKRAGTGKAALYRRWSNVRELGLDVFLTTMAQAVPESYPDTGTLRGDLLGSMTAFAELLRGSMSTVVRELISESAHDPALVQEFRTRMAEPMQAELVGSVAARYDPRRDPQPAHRPVHLRDPRCHRDAPVTHLRRKSSRMTPAPNSSIGSSCRCSSAPANTSRATVKHMPAG